MGQMLQTQAVVEGDTSNVVPLFGVHRGAPRGIRRAGADTRSALALRGWVVQSLLLEAITRDEIGDDRAAGQALERALEVADEDRLVMPFTVDPVPALLERHARCRSTHPVLTTEILRIRSLVSRPSTSARPSGSTALREPLTEGDERVLRYLPTNLSKREIAQELYVSVHTVKTHMKHMYLKLDAHSRRQAVRRARECELLGPASGSR
jgi:LuxR family maltose regulon positive regulatory protein